MTVFTDHRIKGRDFPDTDEEANRKAVCRKCCVVMRDREPCSPSGEFYHPKLDLKTGKSFQCMHAGKIFTIQHPEVEPFMRKGARRRNKRNGVRA